MNKKEQGILNYIKLFGYGTLMMVITNILVVVFLFSLVFIKDIDIKTFYILLVAAALPVGPSITASIYAIREFIEDNSVKYIEKFIYGYKKSLMQSLLFWGVYVVLLGMCLWNLSIGVLTGQSAGIMGLFLIIIFYSSFMIMYAMGIISKYYMKSYNLFNIVFYAPLLNIKSTVYMMSIIALIVIAIRMVSLIGLIFFSMPILFLITISVSKYLEKLDMQVEETKSRI